MVKSEYCEGGLAAPYMDYSFRFHLGLYRVPDTHECPGTTVNPESYASLCDLSSTAYEWLETDIVSSNTRPSASLDFPGVGLVLFSCICSEMLPTVCVSSEASLVAGRVLGKQRKLCL